MMKDGAMMGPQRLAPTLPKVLERLNVKGPLALITAGWQELEGEDEELRGSCGGRRCVNLSLYRRWEEVMHDDPSFARAHRARQDQLRRLQILYRARLKFAMGAANRMLSERNMDDIASIETHDAIEAIRRLDAHHLEQIEKLHAAFDQRMQPLKRPLVAQHRAELRTILNSSKGVLFAGGHVAVLLNRLRGFDLSSLIKDQSIIAWSAGAMALSGKVVLYHDNPPQGFGHPEVFDSGLHIFPQILPFTHSRRRLLNKENKRIRLLAQRFAPLTCATFDEHSVLLFQNGVPYSSSVVQQLHTTGSISPLIPGASP